MGPAEETQAAYDPRAVNKASVIGGGRLLRDEQLAREKSAIDSELQTTQQLTEVLHATINDLESKVQPVRADYPQTDGDRARREQMGSSNVYYRIYEHNETILIAIERVRRVIRELEV